MPVWTPRLPIARKCSAWSPRCRPGVSKRGLRASWLPQIDLIAQYALLAKYNNYEQYFSAFQRHNGQLGASIVVPIFAGRGADARATQADLEVRS